MTTNTLIFFVFYFLATYSWAQNSDFKNIRPGHRATLQRNPWGFFEFWWQTPFGDGPYTLEVAKDQDFKNIIYFQTVKRNYEFTRHIPDRGNFYWRVRFQDKFTPTYQLTTMPPNDRPLKILGTKKKDFDLQLKHKGFVELSWHDPSGYGPYDVEISPDPNFKKLVFKKRVLSTSYRIEKFADAGKFYWRVRKGRIISPTGQFRINQAMVNKALVYEGFYIKPLNPTNSDRININADSIIFRWEALPHETEYHLEISNTGDFDKILVSEKTETSHLKIDNLQNKGVYFWRVSSPRFESPVQSFILSDTQNILQQSWSLVSKIFSHSQEQSFWFESDYRASAISGNDLVASTAGTLKANQYLNIELGYAKNLLPTWDLETSIDYSLIDRKPPTGFDIQTPVTGLLGFEVGLYNFVLTDLRMGLFTRYSEFEITEAITGSSFFMGKVSGLSFGARGDFSIWRSGRFHGRFGAMFFSTIPIDEIIDSAFTRELNLAVDFPKLFGLHPTLSVFWEDIGVIKPGSSQSSEAIGLRFRARFR